MKQWCKERAQEKAQWEDKCIKERQEDITPRIEILERKEEEKRAAAFEFERLAFLGSEEERQAIAEREFKNRKPNVNEC